MIENKINTIRKFGYKTIQDFIHDNYIPYEGNESFLAPPTERTKKLNKKYEKLRNKEIKNGGVLGVDVKKVSTILSHNSGYLDKSNELIVGLQTEKPLIRGLNVFGGMRMAKQAAEAYGYKIPQKILEQFKFRTTHNDGVFKAYTKIIRKLRSTHVLTGLPDAYGRGRILGDYRRIAFYGVDYLIAKKENDLDLLGETSLTMDEETIRRREEVQNEIQALKDLIKLGDIYGINLRNPAETAKDAIQAIYMGYLAAVKEQNGAAMSLGRTATFIDIYIENDIAKGILTEEKAQELIDDFVLHLRMTRQLRTPEYNELFAGDPTWITESLGGMGEDGRTLVTKTCFRFLHTLDNLGHAPEPNLTILWSKNLPLAWKKYCAKMSIKTNSIQYENDDLMRNKFGDNYSIACCVSAMDTGKEMQFFGARCNLPKLLLLAINDGRDEIKGLQLFDLKNKIFENQKENIPLDFNQVLENYKIIINKVACEYVKAMNIIHFMHDKYAYESLQMALHDTFLKNRWMAFGIAGLSVAVDSLSAIKYAKVYLEKDNEKHVSKGFRIEGDYPKFGNNDDRVDKIAQDLINYFYSALQKTPCYRNAKHTLSILTITSNVMYGKNTGATPDGRKAGQPFAPGANPMHNRDNSGAIASLYSVSKINYNLCQDGISNTFTLSPSVLTSKNEKSLDEQAILLVQLLNGYFSLNSHHLNVNVFDTSLLKDAQLHPEKYPNLTIRVSGYAVKFNSLTKEQQNEVIARTCHIKN